MARPAYHLRQAVHCLRQTPLASAAAAVTVALALAMSAAARLAASAVSSALQGYAAEARITVFVSPPAPGPDGPPRPRTVDEGRLLADEAARAAGPGASAEYVDPEHALRRLRAELDGAGEALAALATNPLPETLEVRLAGGELARGNLHQVREAAARLEKLPFAEEVDWGRAFVDRLEEAVRLVRGAGAALFALVLAAALFLVGNVVRLAVYARREEIEILRLVGATDTFVAAAFVLEGALQGLAGGAGAAGAYALLERLALPRIASAVGFGAQLLPPPAGAGTYLALWLAGGVIGVAASVAAVARFLRRIR